MSELRAQGNVDGNGDVVDVLVDRLRRAIDPDAAPAEAAEHAQRIRDDVLRRRAAAAQLVARCSWVPGGTA